MISTYTIWMYFRVRYVSPCFMVNSPLIMLKSPFLEKKSQETGRLNGSLLVPLGGFRATTGVDRLCGRKGGQQGAFWWDFSRRRCGFFMGFQSFTLCKTHPKWECFMWFHRFNPSKMVFFSDLTHQKLRFHGIQSGFWWNFYSWFVDFACQNDFLWRICVEILVEKLPQCIVKKNLGSQVDPPKIFQKSGYFVSKDWGIIPKDSRHVWMM